MYHLAETGDYTDSTANGFTAVPKGTVTQSVAGRVGAGARFNGPTESRIIASDGELAVNQSLTFEAWVYFTSLQTGDFTGLVTKGRDGADWFGLFKDGANRIVVGSPTIGGPGATTVAAGFNVVAGAPQNHIVVQNNLVHNVAGRGVRINSIDARVDVLNNIIYETASQPLRINQPLAAGSRVRVMNNTFYNPTGQGLSSIESVNPHLVLRNNLIFDSSAGFNVGWINVGSSHNLSDDPAPPCFPGTPFAPDIGHSPRGNGVCGASVASVSFADTTPTSEDLHIQSGSSAENTGVDQSGLFAIDIDGLVREAPWDIGADEFTATHHYRSIGTRSNYGTAETEGAGTTVTATNGSPVVTGSGTSWYTSNRGRGDRITIDLVPYTILSVDSDTQLTLTEVFSGTSGIGKAYTIERKFAALAAWEDCIDGPGGAGCEGVSSASLLGDNRSETGIVYDDSIQAGGLVINGSVTDATHSITLTADANNRHLGIEGGGAVVDNGASTSPALSIQDDYVTLEWLEVANGGAPADGVDVSGLSLANSVVLRNLLIHDTNGSGIQLDEPDLVACIYNNFIYSSSTRGIRVNVSPTVNASIEIYNNTLFANAFNGIQASSAGAAVVLLRNNVAVKWISKGSECKNGARRLLDPDRRSTLTASSERRTGSTSRACSTSSRPGSGSSSSRPRPRTTPSGSRGSRKAREPLTRPFPYGCAGRATWRRARITTCASS